MRGVVAATGAVLGALGAALPVWAGALYNMDAFLAEPHPFVRPAPPAQVRTPAARPAASSPAAASAPVPVTSPPPARSAQAAPLPPAASAAAVEPPRREPDAPGAKTWHGKPLPVDPLWKVVSEVRGGILGHDVAFPNRHEFLWPNPFEHRYESGMNVNAEVLFVSPWWLSYIGSPRPRIGGSLNTGEDTSNVYFGPTWEYLWDLGTFIEGFLGLAWHDGKLNQAPPDRIEFGSRILFHLGLEFGYRFTEHQGLSLYWEHMSNAGWLSDRNQGIDSIGLRYGYRFSY